MLSTLDTLSPLWADMLPLLGFGLIPVWIPLISAGVGALADRINTAGAERELTQIEQLRIRRQRDRQSPPSAGGLVLDRGRSRQRLPVEGARTPGRDAFASTSPRSQEPSRRVATSSWPRMP